MNNLLSIQILPFPRPCSGRSCAYAKHRHRLKKLGHPTSITPNMYVQRPRPHSQSDSKKRHSVTVAGQDRQSQYPSSLGQWRHSDGHGGQSEVMPHLDNGVSHAAPLCRDVSRGPAAGAAPWARGAHSAMDGSSLSARLFCSSHSPTAELASPMRRRGEPSVSAVRWRLRVTFRQGRRLRHQPDIGRRRPSPAAIESHWAAEMGAAIVSPRWGAVRVVAPDAAVDITTSHRWDLSWLWSWVYMVVPVRLVTGDTVHEAKNRTRMWAWADIYCTIIIHVLKMPCIQLNYCIRALEKMRGWEV